MDNSDSRSHGLLSENHSLRFQVCPWELLARNAPRDFQ